MKKFMALVTLAVFVSGCLCGGNPPEAGSANAGQQTAGAANSGQQASTQTTVKQAGGGGAAEKIMNLASAISSGGSYKCTYKYNQFESQTWITGKKYRSETTTADGTFYSVSDGVWLYTWMSGQTTGNKFKIADFQDQTDTTQPQQTEGYTDISKIAETAANVECVPTVVSDATFTPPSNVQFSDMGEVLKQLQKASGQAQAGGAQDACAYCSMMPDEESKSQCQQSCAG